MAELMAIKKCGRYKPGEIFDAKNSQARLLVAIKSARYMTRNMVAETILAPVLAHTVAVSEDNLIKKTRGRPRRKVDLEAILDSSNN